MWKQGCYKILYLLVRSQIRSLYFCYQKISLKLPFIFFRSKVVFQVHYVGGVSFPEDHFEQVNDTELLPCVRVLLPCCGHQQSV